MKKTIFAASVLLLLGFPTDGHGSRGDGRQSASKSYVNLASVEVRSDLAVLTGAESRSSRFQNRGQLLVPVDRGSGCCCGVSSQLDALPGAMKWLLPTFLILLVLLRLFLGRPSSRQPKRSIAQGRVE